MTKARYLELVCNRTRFELIFIAYNLKRGTSIQRVNKITKIEENGISLFPVTLNLYLRCLFA